LLSFFVTLPILLCAALAQDSPLVAAGRHHGVLRSQTNPAPEFRAVGWFNSDPRTLKDFRGQVVLIDYWATWCGPCVAGHAQIQQMAKELGFAVVLMHARYTRLAHERVPAEDVLPRFIAEHHLTLPVAIAMSGD